MTNNTRKLRHLLVRFANRCEDIEQKWMESYELDSRFDGGEFSGPAIARAVEREQDAAARRVGFANRTVAWAVYDAMMTRERNIRDERMAPRNP